jgi:hypothetical protein
MTFHQWSLTEWFPMCSTSRPLFTLWDLCSTLDSIFIIGGSPHLCQWFSLSIIAQRVSFMHYSIWCMRETYSMVCPSNFHLRPSKSFSFYFLMLDDGGCLNSLLPVDLFPSNSTHFLWDQGI